jgi:hypothetical protein
MKITIEDGEFKHIITDAIAYDVLCEEDIDDVCEDLDIELTKEQRKTVARYCKNAEYFPNMEDLREIVRNVHCGYFD